MHRWLATIVLVAVVATVAIATAPMLLGVTAIATVTLLLIATATMLAFATGVALLAATAIVTATIPTLVALTGFALPSALRTFCCRRGSRSIAAC